MLSSYFQLKAQYPLDPTCLKLGTGLNAFLNQELTKQMTHLTQGNLWYSQKLLTQIVGL